MKQEDNVVCSNASKSEKWRKFFYDLRATIFILVMLVFSVSSALIILKIGDSIDKSTGTQTVVLYYLMFALYMHLFSNVLWRGNIWVRCNYCMLWLAGFAFFTFIMMGIISFAIYFYRTMLFWSDDLWSVRALHPLIGIIFAFSFFYKSLLLGDYEN